MKTLSLLFLFFTLVLLPEESLAQAKVMNPGVAYGQLVILTTEDVTEESEKFKSLYALSIPVFAELPMELAVVAGAITLKQQNLLSHVQIKSMARKTPNLDISSLEGGMDNELFSGLSDGDWIHMELGTDGSIHLAPSTRQEAETFARSRRTEKVELKANMQERRIFRTRDIGWQNFDSVGSKAANYAELAKALNTPDKTIVRPGFAIPFSYYQQFVDENPPVGDAIKKILRDPLMKRLDAVSYRTQKLTALQELIQSETSVVNDQVLEDLISAFDEVRTDDDLPKKLKLRSSTNAEDLPNFNGAGLYTSKSYKPAKKGKERSLKKKKKKLTEALKIVWGSVWNLRAYEERQHFQIPHKDVKMGVQVNPSFSDEDVDGVIVTTNIANDPRATGDGIYIEAQRGDDYSVANPIPGIQPDRIFVQIDSADPLNRDKYNVIILQHSNIADDKLTILPEPNPLPTMSNDEAMDLAWQSKKAELHFKPLLGPENDTFALDLEFKIDKDGGDTRMIFLKQARPYIQ